MDGSFRDGVVHLSGNARQQFYDSGGYGRPAGGSDLELAPVEAAHLLYRGDLDAVSDETGDPDRAGGSDAGTSMGFREFLTRTDVVLPFVVYKDLRDRGFYLSPARDGWVDEGVDDETDFVVYPRGKGPADDEIEHRLRVVGERASLAAESFDGHVLAVVDEDGELTYFGTEWLTPSGSADPPLPDQLDATLMDDRLLVWDPPEPLYEGGFFGQRLAGRNADSGPLQLSLLEAAYLAERGCLDIDAESVSSHAETVEGERFDRRYAAYAALRESGAVPKSGFKFGADFRVYEAFDGLSDLGHSDKLVRVVERDHEFLPRELSLDVRLAGGVRKRMVFALTGPTDAIDWLSVERITP
jgi:tRNA-intron endonuclease